MNAINSTEASVGWTQLIRQPPTASIIQYLHLKWVEYATKYSSKNPPFQERDETEITHGLAAYLANEQQKGQQPFHGEFFAELQSFDLNPDGTAKCIGRTDIEWRLYGCPCFIIEFKILDGQKPRINLYIGQGILRFVNGIYAPKAYEGAMCGLVRQGGENDVETIQKTIGSQASALRCLPLEGTFFKAPSNIAPLVARFDTVHFRDEPHYSPISLAHIFIVLPK